MYTARTLLRKVQDVEVDVIEMLPTPFGLVRYGQFPRMCNVTSMGYPVFTVASPYYATENYFLYGGVTCRAMYVVLASMQVLPSRLPIPTIAHCSCSNTNTSPHPNC